MGVRVRVFGDLAAACDEGVMEEGEYYCQAEIPGQPPFDRWSARLHRDSARTLHATTIV